VVLFFRNALRRPPSLSRPWSRDASLLFLLFVMGEAIARESLMFAGCLPLFVACGFVNTSEHAPPGGRGKSRRDRGAATSADPLSSAAKLSANS
jgi:hypothetical protein